MVQHSLSSESTVDILKKTCEKNKIPGIHQNYMDKDISFQTDFFKCKGFDLYSRIAEKRSKSLLSQLSEASIGIMNIAQSSKEKVVVHWNITFIPETVAFLNFVGKIG